MHPLPKLLPKPPTGSFPTAPPVTQSRGKRKRGLNHTACKHCRERRAKCSGERPECATCGRYNVKCVYEAPEGVTRHQAHKQKLADVERSSSSLLDVVELLRQGSEDDAALALRRIRQAGNVIEAVNTLAGAQALLTSISVTAGTPSSATQPNSGRNPISFTKATPPRITSPADYTEYVFEKEFTHARDQYLEDDIFIDVPAPNLPISRWTTVCEDNRLMNHLLSLFWTWDNSVEKALYRPLFEEDLINGDPDVTGVEGHTFCSRFLVNALLALGCVFTTERQTFSESEDKQTRGRKFAEEAYRHFENNKHQPSIPLLQGQFALFVYEGVLGSGAKSVDHFMATMKTYEALNVTEFLKPQGVTKSAARLQREAEGLSWTLWGMYCSEWRATQAFGFRKLTVEPLVPKRWRNSSFPMCQPDSASYWWYPYPVSLRTQRSMKVEIREVDCLLSNIAKEVLDFLYPSPDGPSVPPTTDPQRALKLYNALVQWKLSLPARLRLEDAVQPGVILLHSHAEVMLVGLLRPFSHITKAQFGPFTPKDRCYFHCTSLMDTIWTFRAFANLKCEYWYSHTIGSVAFVVFREHADSSVLTETLTKACKCLHEMNDVSPLAGDTLDAIRGAFKMADMPLPPYVLPFIDARSQHRKDGLLHYAAAAILPSKEHLRETRDVLRFQELLDELDGVGLD